MLFWRHGRPNSEASHYGVEAIAAFDRLIQLNPNNAGAYFNKGNALAGMGRFEEAIVGYDQAIRLAPNVADAYNAKGRALESLGRMDEAQKAYADGRLYGYRE